MSTESAREYAEGVAASLVELERDGWPDDEGVYGWLEGVLDVRRTYASTGELVEVSVLVTVGGPNAWVAFDGRGAEVQASWWSDVVRVWASCPSVSSEVLEALDLWSVQR